MRNKLLFLLPATFLLCSIALHATHNRSGEIIFKKTGGLTVEATVITYTRASSVNADRDSLTICWGDGACTLVARSNGTGELIGQDLKKNLYTGTHTYAAEGAYTIGMLDFNRTAGILNINPPSSDNVPFYLETTLWLTADAAASVNSPVFLEPAVDVAYTFQPYSHVPNAFDADGDSLAYELVTPMADVDVDVPNYSLPNLISPSDDNKIFFDPVTIAVNASDPDAGQHLTLTATGGPFEPFFQEKATFSAAADTGLFAWKVTPEYWREQPYQLVFKAKDDLFGYGLAATRIVRFRVNSSVQQQEPTTMALNISPNPTTGAINIECPETTAGSATLYLFDFQGKRLRTEDVPAGKSFTSHNLTGLPTGLYFVEIQTIEGEIMRGKVIKI